ncbi:MAG: DUF134 domain-containing protein [Gemmatimonadota bacterium]
MPRPQRVRRIESPPRYQAFKPVGFRRRDLEETELAVDEFEALRLVDYEDLDHKAAAERMGISRPTLTRILEKARCKVAGVLVEGKLLSITGGRFDFVRTRHRCRNCGEEKPTPMRRRRPKGLEPVCPECGSEDVEDVGVQFRK